MKKIIFVGGIHGVGKTYFCNELSTHYNLNHYSASTLIANERKMKFSQNKYIENIDGNQDLLLRAINTQVTDTQPFLLDGHFCLLNENKIVTQVPKDIFQSLSPVGIILLRDTIENILLRLKNRDSNEYDASLFQSFQDTELAYAQAISYELNIPIFIHDINVFNQKLYEFIDEVLNNLNNKGGVIHG